MTLGGGPSQLKYQQKEQHAEIIDGIEQREGLLGETNDALHPLLTLS